MGSPGINSLPGLGLETLAAITVGTAGVACVASPGQLAATVFIELDSAATGSVYVGDANVSASRYMTKLNAIASGSNPGTLIQRVQISAPWPEKPGAPNLNLGSIYLLGSAAGQVVHVSYIERMGG